MDEDDEDPNLHQRVCRITPSKSPRESGEKGEATGRNCGDDESGVSSDRVECAPLDGELKPHT